MVKIAFWDNCLCERGTTVALFDYAYFNIKILGNESIVIYNTTRTENNNTVIQKFENNGIKVFGVNDFSLVDSILSVNDCDIFYIIKAGDYEGQVSNICKTVVHCVFNYNQPHGNVYAGISNWIKGGNGIQVETKFPVVPHMVHLPDHNENMRKELNIPEDAIVFGRHGGMGAFDIKYVQETVHYIATSYPNIYFLLLNTELFCEKLPNIIYLNQIIDLNEKTKFINTCDAMLWARYWGESFGLSIAEFSIRNKPVFVTRGLYDNAHLHLLGDKGIYYDENTLFHLLVSFNKEEAKQKDWNAYHDYTPEKVMQIFKKVFID